MSDALPQGWSGVKLGKIASKVGSGATPRGGSESYKDFGIPLIRSQNVRFEGFTPEGLAFLNQEQADALKEVTVRSGDVLLNITGASIGRVTQAPRLMEGARVNQHVCIIRPLLGVDAEFLARYLASPSVQEMISTEQYGVTRQALTKGQILEFDIPVPPYSEQQRIVAKLAFLLSKVNASQKRLAKIPDLLNRFHQSVLAAACSGRLTADWRVLHGRSLEEDWREETLAGVCTVITDGDHQPPPKQTFGIPFLTIGNVSSGQLDFSNTRFVSERYFAQIKPDRRPVRGDVLYTVVATIGVPVLVNTERPFCFQRHIALLRASKAVTPVFLRTLLGSPVVVHEAWSRATGTAQATLSLSNLRTIPINLPPIAEQQEIVRRVEALFALTDQIDVRYAKAKAYVDKVTASVLARAFRGELVPTEAELARQQRRNYEPASALLERLQRERNGERSATREESPPRAAEGRSAGAVTRSKRRVTQPRRMTSARPRGSVRKRSVKKPPENTR